METPYTDPTETERLLDQVRAGDRQALDHLLASHRDAQLHLVRLRLDPKLRAKIDASDVVQNAQVEAARRLPAYLEHPSLPFHLWIRQITYDQLLMEVRKHQAKKRGGGQKGHCLAGEWPEELGEQLMASGSTPSQKLIKQELARQVQEAIGRMSEGDREIVLLRIYEGLSNQDAARVLAIDPVAASKRYGRALLRLRQLLLDSGLGESRV